MQALHYRSLGDLTRGRDVYATRSDVSVREACQTMARHQIGALAVVDDGRIVGIISERDVTNRVVAQGLDPAGSRVRDVMTAKPCTLPPQAPIAEAVRLMTEGGFRHVPISEGDTVLGMISMRDVPLDYQLMHARWKEAFSAVGAG